MFATVLERQTTALQGSDVNLTNHRRGAARLADVVCLAIVLITVGCASSRSARVSIYPDDPEPEARIEAAQADAAREGKRVLLNFGANWCSDSRAMYRRLTQDRRVAPFVEAGYVMVLVDVGERGGPRWDGATVRHYGRPFAERGIPALVVLGPDGSVLNADDSEPLRDNDHRHPRKVARWLQRWSVGAGGS